MENELVGIEERPFPDALSQDEVDVDVDIELEEVVEEIETL